MLIVSLSDLYFRLGTPNKLMSGSVVGNGCKPSFSATIDENFHLQLRERCGVTAYQICRNVKFDLSKIYYVSEPDWLAILTMTLSKSELKQIKYKSLELFDLWLNSN